MSRINAHAVFLHDELDFVYYRSASGFDPEHGSRFDNVISSGILSDDT